jgi:hypothetical protein
LVDKQWLNLRSALGFRLNCISKRYYRLSPSRGYTSGNFIAEDTKADGRLPDKFPALPGLAE